LFHNAVPAAYCFTFNLAPPFGSVVLTQIDPVGLLLTSCGTPATASLILNAGTLVCGATATAGG
jgi:hypothetical protein